MTQTWDADAYARHARFVSDLGAPLVDLLDPQPGERILDLGCGDGALPGELIPWLEIFAQAFRAAVPPSDRRTLLEEVRDLLRPRLCAPDGTWVVDYVRLRFAADKI